MHEIVVHLGVLGRRIYRLISVPNPGRSGLEPRPYTRQLKNIQAINRTLIVASRSAH
jgi:hypothetical protein